MGGSFGTLRTRRKGGVWSWQFLALIYVPVTEGLTLSLPVPEVISVQPSKAPDHGHDQASDHTVVKSLCVSFPLSHFTGGLVQSLNMLSERISNQWSHSLHPGCLSYLMDPSPFLYRRS